MRGIIIMVVVGVVGVVVAALEVVVVVGSIMGVREEDRV